MKWAKKNDFICKLPKEVARLKKEAEAKDRTKQSSLDPHTVQVAPRENVIAYSDTLFCDAAIQWLVETNQVHITLLFFNVFALLIFCNSVSQSRLLSTLASKR